MELMGKSHAHFDLTNESILSQLQELFDRVSGRANLRSDKEMYDPDVEMELQEEDELEDVVLGELSR